MPTYVIVANGDFLPKQLIETISAGHILVALDGAAQHLRELDISPKIILGDFDSLDEDTRVAWGIRQTFHDIDNNSRSYTGNHDILIVPTKDQSKTDLVKAIHYCDIEGATAIMILCALGGRVDHDEGAKRALRLEYKRTRPITLYTATQMLRFVSNETVHVTGKVGDMVGILGYPAAIFSSTGLTYNGDQTPLHFGYDSICNSLQSPAASLIIQGEALLILTSPFRESDT
jgi:thiamine pyrophosphokinase